MSFLDGIADAIGGSNDPSTEDVNGLTQAQRRQVLYGGLTQLGANLLAAGQPMYGNERARYLAQIGGIPSEMQGMAYNMAQQKLLGMKEKQAAIQMGQAAQMRQVLQSPEFQQQLGSLDPATAQLLRAAAAGGDMATIAKIYDAMQPKMSYAGIVFDPRHGLVIDPFSGTRTSVYGNDQTPGSGGAGTFQRTPGLKPNDFDQKLLDSLPSAMKSRVEMWVDGKMQVPTSSAMRDPRIQNELAIAHMVDPNFDASTYGARAQLYKSLTSGPLFQNVIQPSQKFLNHAKSYLDSYDTLGLDNGLGSWATNAYKLGVMGANRDPRLAALRTNAQGVKDEFAKFMAGKGQLTDMARQLEAALDSAQTPEQAYSTIGKMVELMKGQIEPVASNYQRVYGSRLLDTTDEQGNINRLAPDLLDDTSRKALQNIEQRVRKMPSVAQAVYGSEAAGAAPSAATPPANLLKEGHITEFKNGQQWKLVGGTPVRVK